MTAPSMRPSVHQQRILASFIRRVAEDGYDGTNLADVAAGVGITKGTIVHHFGTKEHLLATMHEQYMLARTAEMEEIIAAFEAPDEQLAGVLHSFGQILGTHRYETVAFQRELVRFTDSPVMAQGVELRRRYFERVRALLDRGIDEGLFLPLGDTRLHTLLIFGSAQWTWTWYQPDGKIRPEGVGQGLAFGTLSGLLVDRSRASALAAIDGRPAQVASEVLGYQPCRENDNSITNPHTRRRRPPTGSGYEPGNP